VLIREGQSKKIARLWREEDLRVHRLAAYTPAGEQGFARVGLWSQETCP
jgi:hypothetical protein